LDEILEDTRTCNADLGLTDDLDRKLERMLTMLLRLLRPIAASGIRRAERPKIGKWSFFEQHCSRGSEKLETCVRY